MVFSINQPAIGIPRDLGKPRKNHDHIHLPLSASHHAMVFLGCWGTLRCVPKSDVHDFFWCQTWVPCQHSIFQCFYSWSILPLRSKTLTCRNWFWMNTTESLYTVTVLKSTGNYYHNTILKHLETACVWWKWVSQVSGCIRIWINIWTPIVGQLDSFATNKTYKKYDIYIYIYICIHTLNRWLNSYNHAYIYICIYTYNYTDMKTYKISNKPKTNRHHSHIRPPLELFFWPRHTEMLRAMARRPLSESRKNIEANIMEAPDERWG